MKKKGVKEGKKFPLRTLAYLVIIILILVISVFIYNTSKSGILLSPEDGLVVHLQFEENLFDTTGVNNGTGTITYFDSNTGLGNASSFDGTARVSIDDFSSDLDNQSITYSVWIKYVKNDLLASENRILGQGSSFIEVKDNGRVKFIAEIKGNNRELILNADTVQENTWHHIVATYDGSKMKLYIDGSFKDERDETGDFGFDTAVKFGIGDDQGDSASRPYKGLIDDVRVYNKALTQADVTALYAWRNPPCVESWACPEWNTIECPASGIKARTCTSTNCGVQTRPETQACTPSIGCDWNCGSWSTCVNYQQTRDCTKPQTCPLPIADTQVQPCTSPTQPSLGLVAHYEFEDSVNDTTGVNNGSNVGVTFVAGRDGKAGSFSGDDYFYITNHTSINNLTEFTWATWIKPSALTEYTSIINKKSLGSSYSNWLFFGGSSNLRGYVETADDSKSGKVSSSNTLSLNTWQHLAMTYNDSGDRKPRLYLDGVETPYTTQIASSGVIPDDSASDLLIGRYNNAGWPRWFSGLMDDLRIYDKALNSTEVAELATEGGTPPVSECVQNWSLGDWTPATCPDSGAQTRAVIDLENCNNLTGKPDVSRTCTFGCVPNVTEHETACTSSETYVKYFIDENNCSSVDDNETLYCDYDDNNLIGSFSSFKDTNINLDLFIAGEEVGEIDDDDLEDFLDELEEETVEFIDTASSTRIEFEHDFERDPLNVKIIEIRVQPSSSSYGYIIVDGIDDEKTVAVDKKSSTSNTVCIKDRHVTSISSLSTLCTRSNEVKLVCPGDEDDYDCSIVNNKFVISGLEGSAVKELLPISAISCVPNWTYTAWGTCSGNVKTRTVTDSNSCNSLSGKPATSMSCSSCTTDWDCTEWSPSECPTSGTQTKTCTDLNVCGTTSGKPATSRSCGDSDDDEGGLGWLFVLLMILLVIAIAVVITIIIIVNKKAKEKKIYQAQQPQQTNLNR